VENLGDLQPLAVKAGLNGVMMGNFLTTLNADPADDRKMFTDLGLNINRFEDNGANPRPDNRSGWLEGETPDIVEDYLDTLTQAESAGIKVTTWNPAQQLRYAKKDKVPARPDGAPNRWPGAQPEEPAELSGMPFGH
jgi:biotin synthase